MLTQQVLTYISELYQGYTWLHLTVLILMPCILVTSLEDLAAVRYMQPGHALSWDIFKIDNVWASGRMEKVFDFLMSAKIFGAIIVTQILACLIVVLLQPRGTYITLILLFLIFGRYLYSLRSRYGLDGAYQATMIMLVAATLASFASPESFAYRACIWLICIQNILSYFIAGVAKLLGPLWRNGTAVPLIMNTDTYGCQQIAIWLQKHVWLSRFLTWSVVVFEVLFPLVLFLPLWGMLTFLVIGFTFHLGTAFFMGLNTFFFSFVAMYPAVIYCWYAIWHDGPLF